MTYEQEIKISRVDADFIEEACQDAELMEEDDVMTYTAVFPDGTEMDVKCCGCQSEYEEGDFDDPEEWEEYRKYNSPSYTEAVLFRDGWEINCTSDVGDDILGEWELEDREGNVYRTNVVAEKRKK